MGCDWPMTELDCLAELHDSRHETPKYVDVGYPMVRVTDIRRGYLDTKNSVCVDRDTYLKFSSKHKPQIGDILFSRVGSYGNSSFVAQNEEFCLGQNTVCISANRERIDPFFLYCCMNSDLIAHQVTALVGGASQGTISLKNIKALRIPCPSLPIQRRIAGILSAYDELIENNQRRIRILEEMARFLYREWFVNFRFPGHEKVSLVDSPLGRIPKGWEVKKLGEILELNYGKALKQEDRQDGSVPVFGSSGIIGHHDTAMVRGPGIIVGRKGNVGSVFWTNDDFYPIDTVYYVSSSLPSRYLFYDLQTKNFINNDAAVPGLNRNQAYSLETFIPQHDLLARFCVLADAFEAQASLLSRQNENLRCTRDLLLPKLISGEIDLQ